MMTNTQAEDAIYAKIGAFKGVPAENIRIDNQPTKDGKPFVPPTDAPWCRVSIDYSPSRIASLGGEDACVRDFGIISIQCFVPKNKGTRDMAKLCDDWRAHLKAFRDDHLEVYVVHAPEKMDEDNFYARIIRAEFRIN